MSTLPQTLSTLVLRTDFSNQAAWQAVCTAVMSPSEDGFLANVEFLDDQAYEDLTSAQLLTLIPEDYEHPLLVVADRTAHALAELPLLVIDLREERGREIRVIAAELWGIENNLSIANMDFHEFAEAVDEDGVFRSF